VGRGSRVHRRLMAGIICNATIVALQTQQRYKWVMDAHAAATLCRYDGCTLGPDGGPAPLVQPMRGGNLREYCSDRHRIAAHRARQRGVPGSAPPGCPPAAGGPPSATAAGLVALAGQLTTLAADVDR